MESESKYKISFLGEFEDKALEREFMDYEMSRNAKVIGKIAIVFGILYMMFFISDLKVVKDKFSITTIFFMRSFFMVMSAAVYIALYKVNNYKKREYILIVYEILGILAFLVILYQYESLTILSFLSVVAITLAIYTIPDKFIKSLIIAAFFNIAFFVFPARNIGGLEISLLFNIVIYDIIIIIYCSIASFLTNYYRRKQYVDSKELIRLSVTDGLTGIYNRAKFNDEINRWVDYSVRYESPISLIVFDIDDFKKVNDRHGHLTGDSVLQNIASIIKKVIRSTDIFARWGGEEFVILMPNTDIGQAEEMTERMRICIEKNKFDKAEDVTCSFGLVVHRKGESADSFIQRADELLYNAKDMGKNTVVSENFSYNAVPLKCFKEI